MNEKGFTLLEMLLVLIVISALLLLVIPSVVNQKSTINAKGCTALQRTVEAQVQAYQLKEDKMPTIDDLKKGKYIADTKCPDGRLLVIAEDGTVSAP